MYVNDYLIDVAVRVLQRSQPQREHGTVITHRMIVDQLVALKYLDAANRYLQPFSNEGELDSAAPVGPYGMLAGGVAWVAG